MIAAPIGALTTVPVRRLRDAVALALAAVGLTAAAISELDVADVVSDDLGEVRTELEIDDERVVLTPAVRTLLAAWLGVRGLRDGPLVCAVAVDRPTRRRLEPGELRQLVVRCAAA